MVSFYLLHSGFLCGLELSIMEGLSRLTGATPSPILLDRQEERVKFADGLKPVLYIPLYMLQVSICLEEKMGLVAALGTL